MKKMKVLSVNCGSSSLKFQMYEMPEEKVLISGNFERIGIEGSFYTVKFNGEKIESMSQLNNLKNKCAIGDTVTLTVSRNNEETDVDITLTETP